jgi:hypothetical protein
MLPTKSLAKLLDLIIHLKSFRRQVFSGYVLVEYMSL